MEICLAVRQGEEAQARAVFTQALAKADGGALLHVAGDALLLALRRRRQDLFAAWLQEAAPRLGKAVSRKDLADEARAFLQALAFAMCDRRLEDGLPVLQALTRRWLRVQGGAPSMEFWSEWLNLAARMARRGWSAQTRFLLKQALWYAARRRDVSFWRALLSRLTLHFTVFARWDGFIKACEAYPELPLFYVLLVRRAGRAGAAADSRETCLLLALRSVRNLVSNAARSVMRDDMEIFRQWYRFLWQLAGDDERRRRELRLLLQLAIGYWQLSLPKTSRRQARFLEDLLQPSVIPDEYRALLERIS